MRVRLIGGPADGRWVEVDTDRGTYEAAIFPSESVTVDAPYTIEPEEYAVERYIRHEAIRGSGWGLPEYVYAHQDLSADDVTRALNR